MQPVAIPGPALSPACHPRMSPLCSETRPLLAPTLSEGTACLEVTAPGGWKSFQLMGTDRKKSDRGGMQTGIVGIGEEYSCLTLIFSSGGLQANV